MPQCASSVFSPLEIFPSHDMSHLTHWAPTHCAVQYQYLQYRKYEPKEMKNNHVSFNVSSNRDIFFKNGHESELDRLLSLT